MCTQLRNITHKNTEH